MFEDSANLKHQFYQHMYLITTLMISLSCSDHT